MLQLQVEIQQTYSNTTLVNVKFLNCIGKIIFVIIQIQHLLMLNFGEVAEMFLKSKFKYNTC